MAKRYRTLRSLDAGSIIKTTFHNSRVDSHRKRQKRIKDQQRWEAVSRRLYAADIGEEWVDEAISHMDRYGYTLNQVNTKVVPYLEALISEKAQKEKNEASRTAQQNINKQQAIDDASSTIDKISSHISLQIEMEDAYNFIKSKNHAITIYRSNIITAFLLSLFRTCIFLVLGSVATNSLNSNSSYYGTANSILLLSAVLLFVFSYKSLRLYRVHLNGKNILGLHNVFLSDAQISNIKENKSLKECKKLLKLKKRYLNKDLATKFQSMEVEVNKNRNRIAVVNIPDGNNEKHTGTARKPSSITQKMIAKLQDQHEVR